MNFRASGDRAAREALALNRVQSSMIPLPLDEEERKREERAKDELLSNCPIGVRKMSSDFLRAMGVWPNSSWTQKLDMCDFFAESETGEALLSVLGNPNVKIDCQLHFYLKPGGREKRSGFLKFTVNGREIVLRFDKLDNVVNKDSMKNIYIIMKPTLYHKTVYDVYEYWKHSDSFPPRDGKENTTTEGTLVYQTDNQADFDNIVKNATDQMDGAGRAVRHTYGRRSRKSRKNHKKTKHVKRTNSAKRFAHRNKKHARV